MKKNGHSKVNLTSSNLTAEKLSELKKILPEVFSEAKIEWDKLKSVLGEDLDNRLEKFNFTWAGKSSAIQNVLIPSKATLKPAKDESIDFDTSENIFIEGDNLEVLKLLQKAYFEKVKLIYIDPPYNTGGDFVYHDNFKAPLKSYLEQTGQTDIEGNKLQTNTETKGRFHSDWLSMMYPRLKLAWNLLKDDGVIFISIDDNEVHHLRIMMNEIFGDECYVALFPWKKRTAKSDVPFGVSQEYEWILCYTKSAFNAGIVFERKYYSTPDYPNDKWRLSDLTTQKVEADRPNSAFDLVDPKSKKVYKYNPKRLWGITKDTFQDYYNKGKIVFPDDYDFLNITVPAYRVFESEDKEKALKKYGTDQSIKAVSTVLPKEVGMSENGNKEIFEIFGKKVFSYPKPSTLIQYLLSFSTKENDIILDFFGGSGSTAHAVLNQNALDSRNRKFVIVQLPEPVDVKSEAYKSGFTNIAEIAKERIKRVIKGYGENPVPLNEGFKVFKLAESNYIENMFVFDPEKNEQENQNDFVEYLTKAKQNTLFGELNELDIVYENIIKEGLSLNSEIEKRELGSNNCYVVKSGESELYLILDNKISADTIKSLSEKDFAGKTLICLDTALDDSSKANLALHVELKTI